MAMPITIVGSSFSEVRVRVRVRVRVGVRARVRARVRPRARARVRSEGEGEGQGRCSDLLEFGAVLGVVTGWLQAGYRVVPG